jgi:hypothetical protein
MTEEPHNIPSQVRLPQRVCVLDLETSKLIKGELSTMPLAFVGTLIYELRGGTYHPGPHLCFLPDELDGLEKLLQGFEGVVLGHNILGFDYEVLEPRISLRGVAQRTVDTLGFLYEKRSTEPMFTGGTSGSLAGLSLDNLAQMNFGRGKAISGRSIPKMWREGRRDEVIAYNKEDLVLTFALWWHMVRGRTVMVEKEPDEPQRYIPPYMHDAEEEHVYEPWRIEIFDEDLPRLTGQRPLYNTRLVRLTGGPPLEEPPPDAEDEPNYWYRGAFALHYLREDEMMISDPRMDEFDTRFYGPSYPADLFDFHVWHEGPSFPTRLAPGEKPIDLDDL